MEQAISVLRRRTRRSSGHLTLPLIGSSSAHGEGMIIVLTLLILLAVLVTRMASADSKVVQQDDAANPQTLGYATPARRRSAATASR